MRIGTSHYTYNLGRISKMTQADLDYMMRMLSDRKRLITNKEFDCTTWDKDAEELCQIDQCLKFLDRQQEDIE